MCWEEQACVDYYCKPVSSWNTVLCIFWLTFFSWRFKSWLKIHTIVLYAARKMIWFTYGPTCNTVVHRTSQGSREGCLMNVNKLKLLSKMYLSSPSILARLPWLLIIEHHTHARTRILLQIWFFKLVIIMFLCVEIISFIMYISPSPSNIFLHYLKWWIF